MMACLVMSQSVGVIIGAMVAASCATYHFRGQRKKIGPVVQHVIILSVASKAQIHLRCSAAEKSTPVEGISHTLRDDAQAGGSGEISAGSTRDLPHVP
jgi:hypothetical protein